MIKTLVINIYGKFISSYNRNSVLMYFSTFKLKLQLCLAFLPTTHILHTTHHPITQMSQESLPTVVVTGGGSKQANAAVNYLLSTGRWRIKLVCRTASHMPEEFRKNPKVSIHETDGSDSSQLSELLKNVNALYLITFTVFDKVGTINNYIITAMFSANYNMITKKLQEEEEFFIAKKWIDASLAAGVPLLVFR